MGKVEIGFNVFVKFWIFIEGEEKIIEWQLDNILWVFIFLQFGVYRICVNFSNLLGNEFVEKEVIV